MGILLVLFAGLMEFFNFIGDIFRAIGDLFGQLFGLALDLAPIVLAGLLAIGLVLAIGFSVGIVFLTRALGRVADRRAQLKVDLVAAKASN